VIDMALDQMVHRVRQAVCHHGGGMSDGELLDCFIAERDEVAFAALVHRHGAMVFGVCRRVVGHVQDAEDAFQATFLVLARKATTVVPREAVGNWLYGVAYRTALEARTRNAKRRAREMQVHPMPQPTSEPQQLWHDLQPVLDRELSRLPDKYRLPVVLCDLEGRARHDVSQQLDLAEGTLSSRLARGRKLLAGRLARHGFALSAGTLALALAPAAASATAPPALVGSTIEAATLIAAGPAAAGAIAPSVAALVEGVLHAMFMTKLKSGALALLLVAMLTTGSGIVVHRVLGGPAPTVDPAPAVNLDAIEETGGERQAGDNPRVRPDLMGKISAVAKDGKSITLETPGAERGAPPQTVEVKVTANTKLLFSGVGVGGAKLTEGYLAHVWIADGAKDTAHHIHLMGNVGARRGPDIAGQVSAVDSTGKTISFRLTARGRDDVPPSIDIRLSDKTKTSFTNVEKGGAKPTEGYFAEVWYADGVKDAAARVAFRGSAEKFERGVREPPADHTGKVVNVMKNVLVLEMPPRERGEAGTKINITSNDKTATYYFEVGAGDDHPLAGYMAQVWLADGSKDTATKIRFRGVSREAPMVRGKVVGIAKDSKAITLETPGKERGDPPINVEVKLGPKATLSFQGVGPEGALLTEGYFAQVTLVEGSTDTAAHVVLGPAPAGGQRGGRE
jgi:RNA polymerase sigma factor (sigma-70 family)